MPSRTVPAAPSRWAPDIVVPRLPGLIAGLLAVGFGIGLMVESGLGLGPWEAFHQGLGRLVGQEVGTMNFIVGIPALLLWRPLGERPGVGTILNLLLIGSSTNLSIALLPTAIGTVAQGAVLGLGVGIMGFGTALYLAADLGPGPRDGLMTGVHHRFGWSIRRARTVIELSVLGVAYLTGGTIGAGTVVFALAIGPIVQACLRFVDPEGRVSRRRRAALELDGLAGD